MRSSSLAIGADIGGTHITAALVDLDKKAIVAGSANRCKVDSHASTGQILAAWCEAIRNAQQEFEIQKVSLAMPGPFDYETGICLIKDQDKFESLYGLNIKKLLAESLHIPAEDITMVNDAASFLQGEVFGGAAKGFESAIGITLGTGLGTCFYQNQVAVNSNLWNMPFKGGIAEDYLSTRWFTNRFFELTGMDVSGVQELTMLVNAEPIITDIFDEFGRNLAQFVIEFLKISPADVIVIGGNIAKSFPFFKASFFDIRHKHFPEIVIRTATLGEEAALMGAASFWK